MLRVFLKKTKSSIIFLRSFLISLYFRYKSEFYFVSFPKSGRTWVRFFLATYYKEKYEIPLDLEFRSKNALVPNIFFTHAFFDDLSFQNIKKGLKRAKNKKVIFLIRDPRDIVVSLYFHELKREKRIPADTKLSEFIRHPQFGIMRIVSFINEWCSQEGAGKSFLLLRYELLHSEPGTIFNQLLNYLNEHKIDYDAFRIALQESQFENMQKKESSGKFDNWRLQTKDVSDRDAFKVRRGKVAGYLDYFSAQDIEYAKQAMRQLIDEVKDFYPV